MKRRFLVSPVLLVLLAAGCGLGQSSQTVTGKHPCKNQGKPAWCLTVNSTEVVYVPLRVYANARINDEFDPVTDTVHIPAPVEDVPVHVDPVVVDGR